MLCRDTFLLERVLVVLLELILIAVYKYTQIMYIYT